MKFIKNLFLTLILLAVLAVGLYFIFGEVNDTVNDYTKDRITTYPITVTDLSKTMKVMVFSANKEMLVDLRKHITYKTPSVRIFKRSFGEITFKTLDCQLCCIYLCHADIGFDLSKVSKDWLTVHGDTAIVKMPPVELLNKDQWTVDETNKRSRVIIEDKNGDWNKQDKILLKKKANVKMLKSLIREGAFTRAETLGKDVIENLIRSYGYKTVIVKIPKAKYYIKHKSN